MKRLLLLCVIGIVTHCLLSAQTIDRPTYVNKYRIKGAFLTKPLPKRTAKSLSSPVCVNGYLWVYPVDLGYFNTHPDDVIANINRQNKYGKDNWRIPTSEELMTMEDNAGTIGLGDDIYMCTAHANGVLRLVATKGDYAGFVRIGDVYWSKTNYGTTNGAEKGRPFTYEEAVNHAPEGCRLPTKEEAMALIYSGDARFGDITSGKLLYFPFTRDHTHDGSYDTYISQIGEYWIEGEQIIYFKSTFHMYGFNQRENYNTEPEVRSSSSGGSYHVRYVKK
ncbi:MAG: DUF1566 domain-containing protein [Paludibacteraceae bacterium]|nr:DUF1566 domain-containing protein [Paludibacteraceae bacterium]